VDLTIGGLVQGELWKSGAPWIDSVTASRVYWVARAHIGSILAAGFIALLVGLTTGPRGAGMSVRPAPSTDGRDELAPRLAPATEAL
jgi:hypothetical protein